MRGCRWLAIRMIGLASSLGAGCLHTPPRPQAPAPLLRSTVSASPVAPVSRLAPPAGTTGESADHATTAAAEEEKQAEPPSDYLPSQTPTVQLDVQPATATENVPAKQEEKPARRRADKVPEKLAEPLEMRISSQASLPEPPADPPEPTRETPSLPLSRPDPPSVLVLRALLDHHPEEEINEQLKSCDPLTRESLLVLLHSIAQLQQDGGVERLSPRDLAAWTERLNTLIASWRSRAQLILERMCFCSHIENFGDYTPLPPEQTVFQPGEMVSIYVQVRNISFRRLRDKYVTVLKARFEIYDESNRDKPPITWASPLRRDVRASPCQDYYINFHFQVPPGCPAGLHTMRIFVEDWTDAAADAKDVPKSRIAQRTLDFRVGGPLARPARTRIAEAATSQ